MDREIIHDGKFIRVVKEDNWEYVERSTGKGDVCAITAITDNDEVILVEQYRIPVHCDVIENCAGLIGDDDINESALSSAKRELLEETGYETDEWYHLYTSPKSPGSTSETEHKFLALNCKKVGEGGGVDSEQIKVHVVDYNSIIDWLKKQEIEHGKMVSGGIYAGLYFYNSEHRDVKV